MSWIAFGIFFVLLVINQLTMFSRRANGITINNPYLAQDTEFIDDLSEAVARSLQRQLNERAKLFEGLGE